MSAVSPATVVVVAQEVVSTPADDTGRTIQMVVGALIALAVLLALLTLWYWRRTDPRRRAAREAAAAAAPSSAPVGRHGPGERSGSTSSGAARPATSPRNTSEGGLSADEWLRLTGPGQSSPKSSS